MIKRFSNLLALSLLLPLQAVSEFAYVGGDQDSDGLNTNSLTLVMPAAYAAEDDPVITTDTALAHSATLNCFSGVDDTGPFDAAATLSVADTGNASLPTNPAIATQTANAAILLLQAIATGNGTSMVAGAPTGYTLGAHVDADSTPAVALQNGYAISAYDLDVGAVAGDDPGAWTHTNTTGTDAEDNSLFTIALKPGTGDICIVHAMSHDTGTDPTMALTVATDWTAIGASPYNHTSSTDRQNYLWYKTFAAAAGVTFSVSPTVTATTATSYTLGYTVSGATTVYFVACNPGETAPDATEVEAGDCGSGADAEASASEAVTGADTTVISGIVFPRHDIYAIPESGGSVVTLADEDRTADSGQEFIELASVSATSMFALATDAACDADGSTNVLTGCADTSDFAVGMLVDVSAGFPTTGPYIILAVGASSLTLEVNSDAAESNITVSSDVYFNPTVAPGDMVEADSVATCDAGTDAITWETDGDFTYTATNCGSTLTTVDYCIQDVSDATGEFTVPACWTTDDIVYLFNNPPEFDLLDGQEILLFDIDVAVSGLDMADLCGDDDAQTMTFTDTNTWATGLDMDSAGSVTGTPTVEDEAGTTISILCQDPGLLSARQVFTQYVLDEYTAPICVGDTVVACIVLVDAAAPWLGGVSISTSGECSETVAANDIISQSPEESTEVDDPLEPWSVVVSTGICWDLTGIPLGFSSVPNALADKEFVALMRQEADGDGVWAYWLPGAIHGSANLRLDLANVRDEANGNAIWARWAPGAPHGTSNLQIDLQAALTADFIVTP